MGGGQSYKEMSVWGVGGGGGGVNRSVMLLHDVVTCSMMFRHDYF